MNTCSKFWNDTFTSLPGGIARRMLMGSSGLVHLGELAEELLTLVAEQGQRALQAGKGGFLQPGSEPGGL